MSVLLDLLFDLLMNMGFGWIWGKAVDTPAQGRTLAEQTYNERRRRFVVFGISGLLLLSFALYTLRSVVDRWSLQAGNTDLLSLSGDVFWGGLALLAAFYLLLKSLGWPDELGLPPLKRPFESESNPGLLELLSDVEAKRREAAAKQVAREHIRDEQIIRALEILAVDDPVDYVRDAARQALRALESPVPPIVPTLAAPEQTTASSYPPFKAPLQLATRPPASHHASILATPEENKGNRRVRFFRWYKGIVSRGLGLVSLNTALINLGTGAALMASLPILLAVSLAVGWAPMIPALMLALAHLIGCLVGIVLGLLGIFEPIWRRPFPLRNSFFGLAGLAANLSILLFDLVLVLIGLAM